MLPRTIGSKVAAGPYNKVLHERVVILNVVTTRQPHCADQERVVVDVLTHALFNVRLQYGFMEEPHVPRTLLAAARSLGMQIDFQDVVYFLGREDYIRRHEPRDDSLARETVCDDVAQRRPRDYLFPAPLERVVELGVQVEM